MTTHLTLTLLKLSSKFLVWPARAKLSFWPAKNSLRGVRFSLCLLQVYPLHLSALPGAKMQLHLLQCCCCVLTLSRNICQPFGTFFNRQQPTTTRYSTRLDFSSQVRPSKKYGQLAIAPWNWQQKWILLFTAQRIWRECFQNIKDWPNSKMFYFLAHLFISILDITFRKERLLACILNRHQRLWYMYTHMLQYLVGS